MTFGRYPKYKTMDRSFSNRESRREEIVLAQLRIGHTRFSYLRQPFIHLSKSETVMLEIQDARKPPSNPLQRLTFGHTLTPIPP